MKILFVCTGNICRSPLADGFARHLVDQAGLGWEIDSVGTGGWHVGEAPDSRAQAVAKQRGYPISGLRGRQLSPDDFLAFDHLIALDSSHLDFLNRHAPANTTARISLLSQWSDQVPVDIEDPYYEDDTAFERAADDIETCVTALVRQLGG